MTAYTEKNTQFHDYDFNTAAAILFFLLNDRFAILFHFGK